MILQWEKIHNDPCLSCLLCFHLYFKYYLLLSLCFKYIYCFHLCFKYYLLLSLCFKYIYCFSLRFKYIYCFHFHFSLRYCNYPFSPCDLGMKILSGLGGLCKTFNGINNHVKPQDIGPMNTPFDLMPLLFPYLLRCDHYPLFPLGFGYENLD